MTTNDLQGIDKNKLIELVRAELGGVVEDAGGLKKYFEKEAAGYPSAMESHSDTNRSQQQHMAQSSHKHARNLEAGLSELDILISQDGKGPTPLDQVQRIPALLSLVLIENLNDGESLLVFLVPGKAGGLVQYVDQDLSISFKVTIVPEEAAMGETLLKTPLGDTFELGLKRLVTYKLVDFK